jgi:hypothetical protein
MTRGGSKHVLQEKLSTGDRHRVLCHGGKVMIDHPGSIAYLRQMAERCRRAAEEKSGAQAEELLELAERCEERLAEHARTSEVLAEEE